MLKFFTVTAILLSMFCGSTAFAQEQNSFQPEYTETALDLRIPKQATSSSTTENFLLLAAADTGTKLKTSSKSTTTAKPRFKERWFTTNKFHQYLGAGSLVLATASALFPTKEEEGTHHDLAEVSAILGGAAVASGLLFHYEDLSLEKGFSNPDNLHALLTTIGALGYFMAVNEAPAGNHAGYGIGGAIFMLGGIKVTW